MKHFVFVFLALVTLTPLAFAQQPATAPAAAPKLQTLPPQTYQRRNAAIVPFDGGVYAPNDKISIQPQSGKEKIIISFYRAAGAKPDFQRWSYLTKTALEAADYDRSVIALNEQVRLQTIFENTDPGEFLVVHAPIDVSQYSTTQNVLFLPAFARGGTLTQEIFGEKIAIVVPDLLKFQALKMSNTQAGAFYRTITDESGNKEKIAKYVIAEMQLRPRSAIFRKAGRVGKDDHYMFTMDLAEMTIWRNAKEEKNQIPMWTWKADWYKPDTDNPQLLQLYKAIN